MTSVCCSLALHLQKEPDSSLVVSGVLCAALGSPRLNKPNSQVKGSCCSPLPSWLSFPEHILGIPLLYYGSHHWKQHWGTIHEHWWNRYNPCAHCDLLIESCILLALLLLYILPSRTPRSFLAGLLPSQSHLSLSWSRGASPSRGQDIVFVLVEFHEVLVLKPFLQPGWVPLSSSTAFEHVASHASICWCLGHIQPLPTHQHWDSGGKDKAESTAHIRNWNQ